MRGKEIILLDAAITGVIDHRVFHARLGNGHELTAYIPRDRAPATGQVCDVGDRVRVSVSAYDMSRGEIVDDVEDRG